jgi:hypothetical protein
MDDRGTIPDRGRDKEGITYLYHRVPTGFGIHPTCHPTGTVVAPRRQSGRGAKPTTHLHPAPWPDESDDTKDKFCKEMERVLDQWPK